MNNNHSVSTASSHDASHRHASLSSMQRGSAHVSSPAPVCLRCGNRDPHLFFTYRGRCFCRRCIDFGALEAGTLPRTPRLSHRVWNVRPVLEFELTPFQSEVSSRALSILQSGRDVLVYAAAGAGKTEISLQSICTYLAQGKKVCFAISRRQVVIEIAARLRRNFPDLHVVQICEGFTQETDGDLIVCTTHQLYRFPFCFDLLVLDELDAFPYAGNEVLESIARQSCIGQRMLLSATPDEKNLKAIERGEMEMVNLFMRPHKQPLCVPVIKTGSTLYQIAQVLFTCRRHMRNGKQVLLFVPRIADTRWMKLIVGLFF